MTFFSKLLQQDSRGGAEAQRIAEVRQAGLSFSLRLRASATVVFELVTQLGPANV